MDGFVSTPCAGTFCLRPLLFSCGLPGGWEKKQCWDKVRSRPFSTKGCRLRIVNMNKWYMICYVYTKILCAFVKWPFNSCRQIWLNHRRGLSCQFVRNLACCSHLLESVFIFILIIIPFSQAWEPHEFDALLISPPLYPASCSGNSSTSQAMWNSGARI